ncbi:hypothetical protein VB152_01735 [Xanthomonas fragariae]|nr:hypothetical protein [Xanthomonas fragariae]
MGANCKKPAFSVANTGSSGTPVQTSRPCGRWVVGVFQGRLGIWINAGAPAARTAARRSTAALCPASHRRAPCDRELPWTVVPSSPCRASVLLA